MKGQLKATIHLYITYTYTLIGVRKILVKNI